MPDEEHDYDPALTERLLEEGTRRLHESRRLLEDLEAEVRRDRDRDGL